MEQGVAGEHQDCTNTYTRGKVVAEEHQDCTNTYTIGEGMAGKCQDWTNTYTIGEGMAGEHHDWRNDKHGWRVPTPIGRFNTTKKCLPFTRAAITLKHSNAHASWPKSWWGPFFQATGRQKFHHNYLCGEHRLATLTPYLVLDDRIDRWGTSVLLLAAVCVVQPNLRVVKSLFSLLGGRDSEVRAWGVGYTLASAWTSVVNADTWTTNGQLRFYEGHSMYPNGRASAGA